MKFFGDLHIHSHYSRATSKNLNFEQLFKWAQIKGITVVGTGDISHPGWLDEIRKKLEPAEEGLYRLKEEFAKPMLEEIPAACQGEVRFMLTGEISNIYKKNDRVRKNHNVVFLPSIEVARKFQDSLEKIGNIRSDGRPILGLDARNLLELVLESHEQSFLIPAHIWTPWFSVLGSKSGFDSIDECFDDLTPHIFALETGLSSDPPMNWRLSALDRYTLVSNSDAHSPAKLAREANIFNCDLSYPAMLNALKTGDPEKFLGTLEFFPEEGKYHLDGHRKCNKRMTPKETIKNKSLCPVCGKKVTIGVLYRVEELADRPENAKHENIKPFHSLIPMPEILSEIYSVGPNTKTVGQKYDKLLNQLGSEMYMILEAPLADIEKAGGSFLAEGIRRMRKKEVVAYGGFDGEFGVIKLFTNSERDKFQNQTAMFQEETFYQSKDKAPVEKISIIRENEESYHPKENKSESPAMKIKFIEDIEDENGLNLRQKEAVESDNNFNLIIAGPGTGKTRALTYRIAHLIQTKKIPAEQILAVTFTNRAANEMQDRLIDLLGENVSRLITIKTFHALGVLILKNEADKLGFPANFSIYSEEEKTQLLKNIFPTLTVKEHRELAKEISDLKNNPASILSNDSPAIPEKTDQLFFKYNEYQKALQRNKAFDFDDLIMQPIILFNTHPDIKQKYQEKFLYISIDEYQDINSAQYKLMQQLTTPETNLLVIGDPDQAIYGFRGSDRKFFLQFKKDFPDAKVFRLEKNYRSDSTILKASSQIIKKNSDHQQINIWSNFFSDTRIDIFQTPSEKSEAETIVHQIEKMVGATSFFSVDSGRAGENENDVDSGFSEIAVLYRTRAQLFALEEAFLRSGIPYQTFGDVPFYEIPEVKEIISFLKVIQNPHSEINLHRIINIPPRGIGEQTLNILMKYQKDNEISLWQAMERSHYIAVLSTTQKQPIEHFVKTVEHIQAKLPKIKIIELIELILNKFGFNSYFKNDKKRQHYWQEIKKKTESGEELNKFLERITLQKETDCFNPKAEKVALMTLHAAKGLEFSVVFIAGCEEGLIPFHKKKKPIDIEEERRLFYVGMTRAKRRLILLHAKSRFLFGERKSNPVSRFLNDIEQALKENRLAQIKDKQKPKAQPEDKSQMELF